MRDLSLHLLDILQNAIKAQATSIWVLIEEFPEADRLTLTVKDNGIGMSKAILQQVQDPFFTTRTERKVGLGLSLLKANALQTGGGFTIASQPGKGTEVTATFGLSHIDRPPLGNLGLTFTTALGSRESLSLTLTYSKGRAHFSLSTGDLLEILEDREAFHSKKVLDWIEAYIQDAVKAIQTP